MRGIGDLRSATKTIDLIEDYCLLQERWRHHSVKQNGETVKKFGHHHHRENPESFMLKACFLML